MKKTKSLYPISVSALIIILCAAALTFSSCGGEAAEPFSPPSGECEIMLNRDEWSEVSGFSRYNDDISLVHTASGTLVNVECYIKTNASDAGISDLTGFADYYAALEEEKNVYKAGTGIKTEELIDVNKKDIKGSVSSSGKRQKIYAQYVEAGTENTVGVVSEVIYLESKNHYFVVYYTVPTENFESSQIYANELAANIKKEK